MIRLLTLLLILAIAACSSENERAEIEQWEDSYAAREKRNKKFQQAVATMNHCKSDNECVLVYAQCEMTCFTVVNKAYVKKVEDLVEKLLNETPAKMLCDCVADPALSVVCHEGRCDYR